MSFRIFGHYKKALIRYIFLMDIGYNTPTGNAIKLLVLLSPLYLSHIKKFPNEKYFHDYIVIFNIA